MLPQHSVIKHHMKKIISLSIGFLLILIVWIAFPYALKCYFDQFHSAADWQKLGTFGDSFGALNTLFSGLALSGLAVSILLQISELKKLQSKEVDTAAQVAAQSNTLRITALLHYYNNEIDRLERLSHLLSDEEDEKKTLEKFWARFEELRNKRDDLVKEIGL